MSNAASIASESAPAPPIVAARSVRPKSWGLTLHVHTLAYWFWFFYASKPFITYLFFQENPAYGTLAFGVIGAGFAYVTFLAGMHLPTRSAYLKEARAVRWFVLYMAWMFVTLLWTRAESTFVAFAYWALLALECFCIFMFLRKGDARRVAIASIRGFVAGSVVMAVVTLVAAGTTGDARLGDDELLNPNSIGNQFAYAALCCLFLTFDVKGDKGKLKWGLAFLVLMATLLQSLSKTSILGAGVAIFYYVIRRRSSVPVKLVLALLFMGGVYLSYGLVSDYVTAYIQDRGGATMLTLSGRTLLWIDTWEMIRDNPWFGYGFFSFRNHGPQVFTRIVPHAHNEWLHNLFSYGVIGTVLCLLLYVGFWKLMRHLRAMGVKEAMLGMMLLIYFLIRGLTEANVVGTLFPMPLLLLLLGWGGIELHARKRRGVLTSPPSSLRAGGDTVPVREIVS